MSSSNFCEPEDEEKLYLVETIPSDLDFDKLSCLPKIGDSILKLIESSKVSIDICSIYTSYLNQETSPLPSDETGLKIYNSLVKAAQRGLMIRFVLTFPSSLFPQTEVKELCEKYPNNISAGYMDMSKISLYHSGIHHTKLYLFDDQTFFLGSANSDWRSYSEVAEIGIIGENTKEAALDLKKIFEMYWMVTYRGEDFPKIWPSEYDTKYNNNNPISLLGNQIDICFTVSPDNFISNHRFRDADALISVINSQTNGTLRLCAMEYSFFSNFINPSIFWGEVDYAIRKASIERNVAVQILVEKSKLREKSIIHSLYSLNGYGNINIRVIKFPQLDVVIPFGRLFHSKSVISDSQVWLGTNNITPDYFLTSTGIGCVIYGNKTKGITMINQMKSVFDRYYNSKYSTNLS